VRSTLIIDDLDQVHGVHQHQKGCHRDGDQQNALTPPAQAMTDESTSDRKDHSQDEKDLASRGIGVECPPSSAKQSDDHSENRQPKRARMCSVASRNPTVGDRHLDPLDFALQAAITDPRGDPQCRIPREQSES
jgi:hypothetical protein